MCVCIYHPFENGLNAPQTEVYKHEMPGGQYSNLQQQAKSSGTWGKMGRNQRSLS